MSEQTTQQVIESVIYQRVLDRMNDEKIQSGNEPTPERVEEMLREEIARMQEEVEKQKALERRGPVRHAKVGNPRDNNDGGMRWHPRPISKNKAGAVKHKTV